MTIKTSAGVTLLIGPAHDISYGEDAAGIAAAILALKALTYVEVGEVEDAGELGDEASTAESIRKASVNLAINSAIYEQLAPVTP